MVDNNTIDFNELTRYAKAFTGLTAEREACLLDISGQLDPMLAEVTEKFYAKLTEIPETAPFIEGRLDTLKQSHLAWIKSLFSGPFDVNCTELMYKVERYPCQSRFAG
ncbi:MAG: protoglobin domain-containing protein [Gammaproteobacteria bacterium]|nr:protoglobin domain-containing protein [Gammaproteobacteria bacterium]